MNTSHAHRRWIAAGVRHELFSRILPALRHDMAAPVSVLRMGLLLFKRQVAAATVDATTWGKNIEQLDEHISEMVRNMRSLRDWELGSHHDDITRTRLVAQCAGLMRSRLELQGIALTVDDALQANEAKEAEQGEHVVRWPAAVALRYLLIGALCHLSDTVPDVGAIRIGPDGADALCASASPRLAADAARPTVDMRSVHQLPVDAAALQALADDLGYVVKIAADSVRFALAPAVPAAPTS